MQWLECLYSGNRLALSIMYVVRISPKKRSVECLEPHGSSDADSDNGYNDCLSFQPIIVYVAT